MKQAIKNSMIKKYPWQLFACMGVVFLLLLPVILPAQTDSTTKKEEPAKEAGIISPAIQFASIQKADKTIDLKATLKAKVKGVFIKLSLLRYHL